MQGKARATEAGQRAGMKVLIVGGFVVLTYSALANIATAPMVREEMKRLALEAVALGYICSVAGVPLIKCQADLMDTLDRADRKTR